MKRTLLLSLLLCACTAFAQSPRIYSISTGPGEDASRQAGISWATDTTVNSSYVLLSRKGSYESIKIIPQQQTRWTAFDGVWSDRADGSEFYENVIVTKCGAMLTDLEPDTDYQYVIRTDAGEQSAVHYFKTAGAKKWATCIISDFHSYTPLPGRLVASMDMIDTVQEYDPSVSWVFSPGDVVAWGGSYSFWKRLFEEPNFHEMMWGRVNGNHDNWTKESQVTKDYDIPNDYFLGTSFFPQNGYDPEMGVCYHFRYGNTLFIMLNTEDMKKDGEFEAAADWMRSTIQATRNSSNPPTFVVVCEHYEWFIGTNGRTSEYGRWSKIFDELGVDLAVAGNNHVYLRTPALYDGKIVDGKRNGTVYIQTSASDNDRGRAIDEGPMQNEGLIAKRWSEGSHSVSAIHMAVDKKKISLTLLDRNGKELDKCTVYAKKR